MMPDRRKFVKNIAAGTAGIALGPMVPGVVSALSAREYTGQHLPSRTVMTPVFPFFCIIPELNIGDYIPKDQGGKFIQMALINSEDDKKVTEAIRGGLIQKVYGIPTGWSKFEKTEIEKSVWLNRFYFLPSFARLFYLTGDRSYLNDMMRIITGWITDNPRLPDSHLSTYNWRDMQVAWRSIHLSWCYYLSGDALTVSEKTIITDTLKEHASILLSGFGKATLNEFNHQSHGALAMLYLGILFPGLPDAGILKERAIIILNHHLDKAFYGDGGNVEQMFGYYPFVAHIFRDAYMLCVSNGIAPPENSLTMLRKMRSFIAGVATPQGTMPQVNDSYEMPVTPTLDTIDKILADGPFTEDVTSVYFPDTQIGIMRDEPGGKWYMLANPALTIGSHAHAGRLALNLWYDGNPVLIDSGCCNYDDPLLYKWYRTTRAHNSVMIDGKSDEATSSGILWAPKRQTENRITEWVSNENFTYCRMESPSDEPTNSSVSWCRSIAIVKDDFAVLYDHFEAKGEHTYEILFHFPPVDVTLGKKSKSLTIGTAGNVSLIPADPRHIDYIKLTRELASIRGVNTPAPMAAFSLRATGNAESVFVIIPVEKGTPAPKIKQKRLEKGILLTVTGIHGETAMVLGNNEFRLMSGQRGSLGK